MTKLATPAQIEDLSIKDLALYYNELTGSKIKKFSDRATGIKRILEALEAAEATAKHPSPEAIAAEEAKAAPAPKAAKKSHKLNPDEPPHPRARKAFVFPASKVVKDHRPGTARDIALQALLKGATFGEVQEATGWDTHKKAYEGIRLLNTHLGYGLKEDAKGVIVAYTHESK